MDKKTRVMRAMDNQEADKIPVGFWFHFSGDEAVGRNCADAHVKHYRDSDTDFIKIMCDGYFPYPFQETITKASDWNKIKPLGKSHHFVYEQIERAKWINEAVKGECCVFYNVFAPFSSIRFGSSDQLVMEHLKEDKKAVMNALEVIAEDNALIAESIINEAGCTGAYFCVQGGEENRFTYDEYREMITPSDLMVLNRAQQASDYNMIHLCGWAQIKNNLEVWRDYRVKAVNYAVYIEGMSLKEGKEYFNGKCILGGFDNRKTGLLFSGTKEEIQAFTKNLVAENGKTGFMLGADCSLPSEIERERIKWVVDAVSA